MAIEQVFTFIGIRPDGAAPIMEISPCLDQTQAVFKARLWIQRHPSCNAVEIWDGDLLLERIVVWEPQAT